MSGYLYTLALFDEVFWLVDNESLDALLLANRRLGKRDIDIILYVRRSYEENSLYRITDINMGPFHVNSTN